MLRVTIGIFVELITAFSIVFNGGPAGYMRPELIKATHQVTCQPSRTHKLMAGDQIKDVILYWAEGEINSFFKVWLSAYISLFYCYFVGKILNGGVSRLACFLPVVCLFLLLPLQLHSMHLGGITAFFLAWLTNFKLLMFAFNRGPLANPSISFPRFLAVACLPIKLIQQNPQKKTEENETSTPKYAQRSIKNYAMKGLLLALIVKIYSFEEYIHPRIILVIYCFHIYFALEIMLAIAAAMARGLLGAELEPQFNEPYLSTSLQDFWGRRWNLMVTRILRPTVYIPVLHWSTGLMGRDWAPLPAVMSTFVVSGLIHELIFFYLGRVKPTWEITWFFLLHGVCLNVEIAVKKVVNGRWQLPMAVSTILTVGFVMVTRFSLFFPPLMRCGGAERGLAELFAVGHVCERRREGVWFGGQLTLFFLLQIQIYDCNGRLRKGLYHFAINCSS